MSGERGAATIIVAVSLTALIGAAMLSIDAGRLWSGRRSVVAAADATALAEARRAALAGGSGGCSSDASALAADNAGPGGALSSCTVLPGLTGTTGHVKVATRRKVDLGFAGLFGIGSQTVEATAGAMWGFVTKARGLRPAGICAGDPHLSTWLAGLPPAAEVPPGTHPAPDVHRIHYDDRANGCGWVFLDFNGKGDPNLESAGWIRSGYPELVEIAGCTAGTGSTAGCELEAKWDEPGHVDELRAGLDMLAASGSPVPLAITGTPSKLGGRTYYPIQGFVGAVVRGHCLHTPQLPCPPLPGGLRSYLDVQFSGIVVEGNCCLATGADTGVRGLRLCTVDHDPLPEAVRCTPATG